MTILKASIFRTKKKLQKKNRLCGENVTFSTQMSQQKNKLQLENINDALYTHKTIIQAIQISQIHSNEFII